jgi:hypothetical protein
LRGIKQREEDFKKAAEATGSPENCAEVSLEFTDNEILPFTSPKDHHHIADSQRYYDNLTQWLSKKQNDRALKVVSFGSIVLCVDV